MIKRREGEKGLLSPKSFKKVIKTFFRFFFQQKKKRKHIGMILKQYLVQKSLNGTLEAKKKVEIKIK